MTLAAVYSKLDQANGSDPPSTTLGVAISTNVSPASGIVTSALTGDSRAGACCPGGVLGTGSNPDLTTIGPEAV